MNTQNLTIHLTQTKKQKVGTLAIKDRKIYFEYDKDFLTTGIEIAPYRLPFKVGLQRCDNDTLDEAVNMPSEKCIFTQVSQSS